MDGANENGLVARKFKEKRVFAEDPFLLIDVGCSGGIHPMWRVFGDDLIAYGFDPQQSECERLQAAEKNPRVKYHACFIGLQPSHQFYSRKKQEDADIVQYFNPWNRLSTAYAQEQLSSASKQSNPTGEDLVEETQLIGVDEFVRSNNLTNVDFIKIDVDGPDLEALISSESIVRSHGVLGFQLEVNLGGSDYDTDNSLHNTDRRMRKLGYTLCDLAFSRYSRNALPAQFKYKLFAQTVSGQPIQADFVYLRDVSSPHYKKLWDGPLPASKILKMIVLQECFNLPDMAAETIDVWRDAIAAIVDPGVLLDALTPKLGSDKLAYQDYIQAFKTQTKLFFPASGPGDPDAGPTLKQVREELLARVAVLQEENQSLKSDFEARVTSLQGENQSLRSGIEALRRKITKS